MGVLSLIVLWILGWDAFEMEDVSAIVTVFTDLWGQDGYEMGVLAIVILFTYLCGKEFYGK